MLLEIKDLNIEFYDRALPETVVHDFNLSLEKGEIVGIVGESGSGKTMTALALAGLLRRHDMKKTGSILFQGVDLLNCKREELRKKQGKDIGMIFQEPMTSLNPVLRIGVQVEEGLKIHTDFTKEERYAKVLQALRDVELSEPEKVYTQYPHELSGGMRQRVMIAAAMICNPKLLIADEATTALDVTIQAQLLKLLQKVNQEKHTAILFISHDLSLVRRLCGRVAVMQAGYLVEEGRTERIYRNPKEAYTKQLIAAIPVYERQETAAATVCEPSCAPVLEVEHLSVGYTGGGAHFWGKGEITEVCRDVSFQIRAGEIVGLVGESGCGKSTLAKAILSMIKVTGGEFHHASCRPQMVFQDPYASLNPSKRIGWILEEPMRIKKGSSKEQRREEAGRMLRKVGLPEDFAKKYPKQLSGGQRQRVCIAAALMAQPSFLIADEALSALDVTVQAQIMELLLSLHKEMGLAILFISHDLRIVYRMCDRILIMQNGEIVEEGSPREVYENPKHSYTRDLLAAADIGERDVLDWQ